MCPTSFRPDQASHNVAVGFQRFGFETEASKYAGATTGRHIAQGEQLWGFRLTKIRFRIHSETGLRFGENVHSICESDTGFTLKNRNPDSIIEYALRETETGIGCGRNGEQRVTWMRAGDDRWRRCRKNAFNADIGPDIVCTPGNGQPGAIAVIRLVSFTAAEWWW